MGGIMTGEQYLALVQPLVELVAKKHADYNAFNTLESYFPFGHLYYVQMLHIKTQRLVSLCAGGAAAARNESIEDTVNDLINYAVFYKDFLKGGTRSVPAN
jgi:hypothetical protein